MQKWEIITTMSNLDSAKCTARDYHDSGQYEKDINTSAVAAQIIIDKYLGQLNKTIVIDIDETLISEYPLMLKYDFGWFDESLDEAQIRVDFPSFFSMVGLVNYCMDNGIAVNILSSRRQKYLSYVLQLFKNNGITRYTSLILRPDNDTGTIQDYKIRERQKIVAGGYDIIANIGDQQSDLDGGYPDDKTKQILVPNPFYLITSDM